MDRGIDFLKSQVNNAVMQHRTFLENLQDHESQAEDTRFRRTFGRGCRSSASVFQRAGIHLTPRSDVVMKNQLA